MCSKQASEWIIPNGFSRSAEDKNSVANSYEWYDKPEFLLCLSIFQKGTLWMNLGYGGDWDPTVAGEALFLHLFQGIDIAKCKNVVDVSSGYGDQERSLQSIIPELNYVGVNPSATQNNIARYRANPKSTFLLGAVGSGILQDWPEELKGSYDMIISNENAFHFPCRDTFYTNFLPLLSTSGYIFVHDMIHSSASKELLHKYFESKGYEVIKLENISDQILGFKNMEKLYPKWQPALLGFPPTAGPGQVFPHNK